MQDKKIIWTSEKRKISELNPAVYNPRQLTEKQAKDLAISLERFSLADPIVINKNNTIIGGHQRINILKQKYGSNGFKIDVRVPDRLLSQKEETELNLRLNKNLGEWDFDQLANFDEDLLKDIGFDSKELDRIFQLDTRPEDDDVPEVRTTDIKRGDMFKLGEHVLLCGDCTIQANVARLMGGLKADMVFTDPPYGIDLNTDYTSLNSSLKFVTEKHLKSKTGNKYSKLIGDDIPFDPQFILDTFNCDEIFLWGGDYYLQKLPLGGLFVWDKRGNEIFDKMYGSCFELCWSKAKHKRDICRHTWAGVFGTEKEDQRNRIHPTQKPVGVCEWFIGKFSKRDNLIIDLFGGSGSTLIACEKLNRKCRMMEIDPIYCQVIIDRWEKYTNGKANKIKGRQA